MRKRITSLFLVLALCLAMMPTAALAETVDFAAQTPPAVEEAADPANGEAKQENQPAEQEEQQETPAVKQDEAVANVQAMIDALPDAAELDGMDDAARDAVHEAFQAACDAYYDTLTEEQQAQLKNTEKLAALSDWFSQTETLAEETGHPDHPICGDVNCEDSSHALSSGETWTGVDSLNKITKAGNYYLTGNVTLTTAWTPTDGVVLCLNGYSITANANVDTIIVKSDRTFTLTDCEPAGKEGKITHGFNVETNKTHYFSGVVVSGTFNIYGGSITGNNQSGKAVAGGGVYVGEGGIFNMYGGKITDNISSSGGGVGVSGTFNMYGGTISGNTADGTETHGGGGVSVGSSSTFTMNGGTISGNKAVSNGGGVRVCYGGTFTMNDGTISKNTATNGGGVYVSSDTRSSTFTMSGGTITKNNATYGGGVYMGDNTTFTMENGSITGNNAGSGGGVYVSNSGAFTMNGGSITGNTAKNNGGGVFMYKKTTFTMENGTITGNNAGSGGGVCVVSNVTFNMKDGTISGNNATRNGGGVCGATDATFTFNGTVNITGNCKGGTLNDETGKYTGGTKNNVHLFPEQNITIGAGLTNDARIGITTTDKPMENFQAQFATDATNTALNYAAIFIPDEADQGYVVIKGEDNKLYLSAHQHNWTYKLKEGTKDTIIATCDAADCTDKNGGSVTIKALDLVSLDYDGKPKAATLTGNDWQGLAVAQIAITYKNKDADTTLGTAPTDAGKYEASITLGEGNNAVTASVEYTISQAFLQYTIPDDVTAVYGDTLAKVTLPTDEWTWENPEQSVGNVGEHTFNATYTPKDPNYKKVSGIDVPVTVNRAPITISITGMPEGPIAYGDTFVLTITQTGDSNAVPKNWTKFSHDRHLKYLKDASHPEEGKFKFQAIGVCSGNGCSRDFTVEFESETHKGSRTVGTPTITKKTLTKDDLHFGGLPTFFTKDYDGSTSFTKASVEINSSAKVDASDALPEVKGSYAYNSANVKEASKVTFTSEKTESEKYILPAGLTVEHVATITKANQAELTVTSDAATYGEDLTLTVSGGAGDGAVSYTVKNGTGEATIVDGSKLHPTKAGTVFVTATKAGDNNYEDVTSAEKEITIAKASYGDKEIPVSAKIGSIKTVDLTTGIVPGGSLSWSAKHDDFSVVENPSLNDSTFSFTVRNSEGVVGKIAQVSYTVSSGNYADYVLTITIKATDKDKQTGFKFENGNVTKTYGDAGFTFAATGAAKGSTVTYESSDKTVATVDANGKVTILKAGSTNITATAAETADYEQATATYTLTVEKKTVIVKAKDQTAYVGDKAPALGEDSYTVSGLVGEEKLTTLPTVKYVDADGNEIAPDMTKTGEVKIRVGDAAASGNYTICYEDGKLTITTRPSSGGGSFRPNQKPTIQGSEGAKTALSADGTKLTITVEDGYEITDVLVNGVSKGAVAEITGLKTGDKVEVKTAKKTEPTKPTNPTKPSADKKAKLVKGVQNTTIVVKTKLTKDGKILLTWKKSKGYKVDKFEIYRSVKKNSGYGKKPFFTTKGGSRSQYYLNTKKLKAGRTYYYKVRGVRIIDGKKYYTHWSNKVWRSVK